ncbi:MAG: hypothetical protein JW809_08910 [Pirellulales bacterium]|nr:hypothetical protein [Pirellulales bacterium]
MNVRPLCCVAAALATIILLPTAAQAQMAAPAECASAGPTGADCSQRGPAAGDPVTNLVRMICRDFKRNNCWPDPFVCPDRQAVREPFVRMVAKGWVRQNTLGEHHFEPENGKLTYAGVLKVRKILLEGLPEHRTIYVYRALKPGETAARVDAVQQLAAETLRTGELPAVLETDLPAPGWPADQVDGVSRRYQATMPDPRLPAATGDAGSSSDSQ